VVAVVHLSLVLMAHHGQQQVVQVVVELVVDICLGTQVILHKQRQVAQTLEVVVVQQLKVMVWLVVQALL
tara:strand:+ start:273 stop:482 length:210 start_codon:yes stop_codon:yes gene_type:complete